MSIDAIDGIQQGAEQNLVNHTYHDLIPVHDDYSLIREKTHGCKSCRGGRPYKEILAEAIVIYGMPKRNIWNSG